jgi:nuclear pore complex protein Nup107
MVPSPEIQAEALVKANDIARYFLALGQASAAKSLLDSLPEDVAKEYIDRPEYEDAGYVLDEHDAMSRLFEVFAAFEKVELVASEVLRDT